MPAIPDVAVVAAHNGSHGVVAFAGNGVDVGECIVAIILGSSGQDREKGTSVCSFELREAESLEDSRGKIDSADDVFGVDGARFGFSGPPDDPGRVGGMMPAIGLGEWERSLEKSMLV